MQKWYELWFKKMLFLSEHATVYLLLVNILFANTKNNRVQTQVRLTFVFGDQQPKDIL